MPVQRRIRRNRRQRDVKPRFGTQAEPGAIPIAEAAEKKRVAALHILRRSWREMDVVWIDG